MNRCHGWAVTVAKDAVRRSGHVALLALVGAILGCGSTSELAGPRADAELAADRSIRDAVRHPGDGFASINDAVAAAGCGGTVLLAAGVYNERIFASCGVRIVGSGAGQTILSDAGLEPLQGAIVNFGGVPFAPGEFTAGYELSGVTLESGPEHASLVGAGAAWTRDVFIHDAEIRGFIVGVGIAVSTDSRIENVHVVGQGRTLTNPLTKCITIVEFGIFLEVLPHMTGHVVRGNRVEDCALGVDVQNSTGAVVAFNRVQGALLGINVFGASGLEIHHNVISDANVGGGPFSAAGIDPSNIHDSEIHNNVFCNNTIGVHFSFNQEPDAFGFAPSSGNAIHHNRFAQSGEHVVFSAPTMGPDNRAFANLDVPSVICR